MKGSGPTALTVLGILLLVVAATFLGSQVLGQGRVERVQSSVSLLYDLGPLRSSTPAPGSILTVLFYKS